MSNKYTIYALSTYYGKSGIAIIRLSGNNALYSLKRFYIKDIILPRKAILTKLYEYKTKRFIDESIVIYFPKKNSYTGQDIIEFHIHGSISIINCILYQLKLLKKYRLAYHGEFTKIALKNNKINFFQVEALEYLINSETEIQQMLTSQLYNGYFNKIYITIKNSLLNIIVSTKAYLDFPEETINNIILLDYSIYSLYFLLNKIINNFKISKKLINGVTIVIVGSTNSGKSTFMNVITQSNTSIISTISGTTRDIIKNKTNILGIPVTFNDTAGFNETINPIEKLGIIKTLKTIKNGQFIIYMYDINIKIDYTILKCINKIVYKQSIFFIILNKNDLCKNTDKNIYYFNKNILYLKIKYNSFIIISLLDQDLYKILYENIKELIYKIIPSSSSLIIFNYRQKKILKFCNNYILNALNNKSLDLKLENLKNAINQLTFLLGKISNKKILNNIFKNFCIGK